MGQTALKGNPVPTSGELPPVGAQAPDFSLTKQDLSEATLESYGSKKKILNIFPSIDTGICAKSVKTFDEKVAGHDDLVVLNISADLPFAAKRFCGQENVQSDTLSSFRSTFAEDYGVELAGGPMKGLCARAVVALDAENKIVHTELVPEITTEPDYDAALSALS